MMVRKIGLMIHIVILLVTPIVAENRPFQVGFRQEAGKLVVTVNRRPVTTYVYADEKIPRPYFTGVKTLDGTQVTRNQPPIAGTDGIDHETMHPGIWMAFGDLDGADFWRNKAKIVHQSFLKEPVFEDGSGSFVEEKHYLRATDSLVCKEVFRWSIHILEGSYLLTWDSTFCSDSEFYFGDQEEMGLGLRVATPIAEVNGGRLRDAKGRIGAKRIWSHSSAWCDYSGTVEGQSVGMTLMCHPDNFRESWMHARDYGFVAANSFGRSAMKKGPPSKTFVEPGVVLRLQYAVWIHGDEQGQQADCAAAYAQYLRLVKDSDD